MSFAKFRHLVSTAGLYLCGLLLVGACSSELQGDFAWATTDDRDLPEPERSLLIANDYRVGRRHLYFFDYETIWWLYRIREGSLEDDGLFAVLFENTNTPNPVEFDKRQVQMEMEGGVNYIRQQYEPLRSGRYLLKIADRKSKVIDQVEFEVVLPGGPSQASDTEPTAEEEPDEILRYSS